MTILFCESFDGVATVAQLAGAAGSSTTTKWKSNVVPASFWSLTGGSLKVDTGDTTDYITHILAASQTTLVFGFKYTPDVVTGRAAMAFIGSGFNPGLTPVVCGVIRTGTELTIIDIVSSDLSSTSGLGLSAGTKAAVELKAVHVSGTNWTVSLRVNGDLRNEATLTNHNFGTTGDVNAINIGANPNQSPTQAGDLFDEVYVDDTDFITGANSTADFWAVQCIRPDGAGAHTDWVPSSGANYAAVNEQNVSDASFVDATFDGDEDTYTYDDPTHITGHAVRAVQVNSRAEYLSSAKNIAHVERDGGGTEADGANQALTASLAWVGTVFLTQADGSAWGPFPDLDSYQFGRKQA